MTPSTTQDIFVLVLARPTVGVNALPDGSGLVYVYWRAPHQGDRLVQLYVDGELNQTTIDPSRRDAWVVVDPSLPHTIELLAIDADDSQALLVAHPGELRNWSPPLGLVARAALLRDPSLAIDSRVIVTLDGQSIDAGPVWPATEPRSGFGGFFGIDSFGFDSASGPGLGEGRLGLGPLGSDGSAWEWESRRLAAGEHDVRVSAVDSLGRAVASEAALPPRVIDSIPAFAELPRLDEHWTLSLPLSN